MKINEINHKYNNKNNFNKNHSPKKLNSSKDKKEKESPLSPNFFKNKELRKSFSQKIDNGNKTTNLKSSQYNNILESKNSFLTSIPIYTPTFQNENNLPDIMNKFNSNKFLTRIKSSKNIKKNFELKSFNDERCFSSSKPKKKVTFPKKYYIIKQYRINHDINLFNIKHIVADYTKEYERNPSRIREIYQNDKFINEIKLDILKLKFNHKIKPFDDL